MHLQVEKRKIKYTERDKRLKNKYQIDNACSIFKS